MKKLLGLLALGVAACQSHGGPPAKVAPVPMAAVPALPQPIAPKRPAAPANAQAAAFLRRYDLTRVLQLQQEPGPTAPLVALNGFYGPTRYRIELVLSKVQRDRRYPNRYWVRGKDRYKKTITPLAGYIDFTEARLAENTMLGDPSFPKLYTALGTYELREDPRNQGAGTFRGRVAIDLSVAQQSEPLYSPNYDTPTESGGLTYLGTWTSLATGQRYEASWVADLNGYLGADIITDLVAGDRGRGINPKYARFGWNKYWENDEWWVDSLGAVASRK